MRLSSPAPTDRQRPWFPFFRPSRGGRPSACTLVSRGNQRKQPIPDRGGSATKTAHGSGKSPCLLFLPEQPQGLLQTRPRSSGASERFSPPFVTQLAARRTPPLVAAFVMNPVVAVTLRHRAGGAMSAFGGAAHAEGTNSQEQKDAEYFHDKSHPPSAEDSAVLIPSPRRRSANEEGANVTKIFHSHPTIVTG